MTSILQIINDPNDMFLDTRLANFEDNTPEKKILEIFCYGTIQDYYAIKDSLPDYLQLSSESHGIKKLIKLSLLSAFDQKNSITYSELMEIGCIQNITELEKILVDLVAEGYLTAQVEQDKQTVFVTRSAHRCVKNDQAEIQVLLDRISGIRNKINEALLE